MHQAFDKHENISASNSCQPMMPLHCFMLLSPSSSSQHPNMSAVLSPFIWSFHVHFCKIFSQLQIFSSWEKRSQRAVLGPGLWTVFMLVLAELGPAEAVHQRPGKPSVWASSVRWVQLCPAAGWLPSTRQMSSSPHQHETSPPSLGNKQGPPSSINIDENWETDTSKCCTPYILMQNCSSFSCKI